MTEHSRFYHVANTIGIITFILAIGGAAVWAAGAVWGDVFWARLGLSGLAVNGIIFAGAMFLAYVADIDDKSKGTK